MPAAIVLLIVVFVMTLFITKYVALASMVAAVSLPLLTHLGARFHGVWDAGTWNRPLFFFSLVIAILAIWKHRSNIRRLRDGTEARFVWGGKEQTRCHRSVIKSLSCRKLASTA